MCEAEEDREGQSSCEASNGTFKECANCVLLRDEKRQLNNQVKSLRGKLIEKRNELTDYDETGCRHCECVHVKI